MATKGTAAKSASGASMSKYDVEVEERLQVLESAITELKKEINSHRHAAQPLSLVEMVEELML